MTQGSTDEVIVMPGDHIIELLGAYVAGCLDEGECQEVESHLETCENCRRGLEAYVRVLDDLPLRIALSEPPPDIREKIIERARTDIITMSEPTAYRARPNRVSKFVLVWMAINILYIFLSSVNSLIQYRRLNQVEKYLVRQ